MSVATESEQVEVSASKLHYLISNHLELKKKNSEDVSKLKAIIMAKDKQLEMYNEALAQLSSGYKGKRKGDGTKMVEEIDKLKKFDEWYEKNRETLIIDEFNKSHRADIDAFRDRLQEKIKNIMK